MSGLTDEQLMENLKGGDMDGLGFLYERYRHVLLNYFIRTIQDYSASNDLVMEVFERVYRYRKSYGSGKKFRPWLFRISGNLISDYYRSSNKFVAINEAKYDHKTVEFKDVQELSDRSRALYAAMDKLAVSERKIITMYYLLDMPYEDIAAIEGISINNARIRVCRCLKKLHKLLKNSGIW